MNVVSRVPTRCVPWSDSWLEDVLAIEQSAYSHPWTQGNFIDSAKSGYHMVVLLAEEAGRERVIGYLVAMQGVDEVHLLNITVAAAWQGQGLGTQLLDTLCAWARQRQAQWLWLEVRVSNERARAVYQSNGFQQVGLRKRYYPAAGDAREDAIVMSRAL